MHECSVVEQLIKISCGKAEEFHAGKVKKINLVVGELTGYMEESLVFYFNLLSKNTPVEGAVLSVTYVKPKLHCSACGKLFERQKFSFDCPDCGVPGEMTKSGSEFYIDTMEVE